MTLGQYQWVLTLKLISLSLGELFTFQIQYIKRLMDSTCVASLVDFYNENATTYKTTGLLCKDSTLNYYKQDQVMIHSQTDLIDNLTYVRHHFIDDPNKENKYVETNIGAPINGLMIIRKVVSDELSILSCIEHDQTEPISHNIQQAKYYTFSNQAGTINLENSKLIGTFPYITYVSGSIAPDTIKKGFVNRLDQQNCQQFPLSSPSYLETRINSIESTTIGSFKPLNVVPQDDLEKAQDVVILEQANRYVDNRCNNYIKCLQESAGSSIQQIVLTYPEAKVITFENYFNNFFPASETYYDKYKILTYTYDAKLGSYIKEIFKSVNSLTVELQNSLDQNQIFQLEVSSGIEDIDFGETQIVATQYTIIFQKFQCFNSQVFTNIPKIQNQSYEIGTTRKFIFFTGFTFSSFSCLAEMKFNYWVNGVEIIDNQNDFVTFNEESLVMSIYTRDMANIGNHKIILQVELTSNQSEKTPTNKRQLKRQRQYQYHYRSNQIKIFNR
eukprot:403336552